jgi:hypothetical protein
MDIFGHQSFKFFHIDSKLVQLLVLTHDETFQAVAVEVVLLPKPFLDPVPPTAWPQLSPLLLSYVGKLKKHL